MQPNYIYADQNVSVKLVEPTVTVVGDQSFTAYPVKGPDEIPLATVHEASPQMVEYVLGLPMEPENGTADYGRSNWVWVRLQNGDLFLGTFPQGDDYFAVEEDAAFPNTKDTDGS